MGQALQGTVGLPQALGPGCLGPLQGSKATTRCRQSLAAERVVRHRVAPRRLVVVATEQPGDTFARRVAGLVAGAQFELELAQEVGTRAGATRQAV
jgi:hypothetical protein